MIVRTDWILVEASKVPCECNTVGEEVIVDGLSGIAGVDSVRLEIAAIDTTNTELIDGKAALKIKFDYDDVQGDLKNKVTLQQCHFVNVTFECASQCCPVSALSLSYPVAGDGSAESPLILPTTTYGGNATANAPAASSGPVGAPANPAKNSYHHEEFAGSIRTWWFDGSNWQLIRWLPVYRDGNSVLTPDAVAALLAAVDLATYSAAAGTGNPVNGLAAGVYLTEFWALNPANGQPERIYQAPGSPGSGLSFASHSALQTALNDAANAAPDYGSWTVDVDGTIHVPSVAWHYSHVTLYDSIGDLTGQVPFTQELAAGGDAALREALELFCGAQADRIIGRPKSFPISRLVPGEDGQFMLVVNGSVEWVNFSDYIQTFLGDEQPGSAGTGGGVGAPDLTADFNPATDVSGSTHNSKVLPPGCTVTNTLTISVVDATKLQFQLHTENNCSGGMKNQIQISPSPGTPYTDGELHVQTRVLNVGGEAITQQVQQEITEYGVYQVGWRDGYDGGSGWKVATFVVNP